MSYPRSTIERRAARRPGDRDGTGSCPPPRREAGSRLGALHLVIRQPPLLYRQIGRPRGSFFFSPCGAYEGVYILDLFFTHPDDDLPVAVHSDTHGRSAPIFRLAYLLGIQVMPRTRNWKRLTWYRPSADSQYEHIDALFTDTVDSQLIETHLPDMLRVVLSIREGRFSPSPRHNNGLIPRTRRTSRASSIIE